MASAKPLPGAKGGSGGLRVVEEGLSDWDDSALRSPGRSLESIIRPRRLPQRWRQGEPQNRAASARGRSARHADVCGRLQSGFRWGIVRTALAEASHRRFNRGLPANFLGGGTTAECSRSGPGASLPWNGPVKPLRFRWVRRALKWNYVMRALVWEAMNSSNSRRTW